MIDDVLRDDLVFSDVEQKEVFFLRNDPSAVCQRFVQVAGLPPDRRFVRKFFRIGIADDEAGDISDVIQRLCHGRFLAAAGSSLLFTDVGATASEIISSIRISTRVCKERSDGIAIGTTISFLMQKVRSSIASLGNL